MKSRDVSLVAMMICISFSSRVVMAVLPNIQLTTVIVIISALVMPMSRAVFIAFGSVILSNIILGMGVYTYWQIITWSAIVVITYLFRGTRLSKNKLYVSIFSGICGMIYGFIISWFGSGFVNIPFLIYYIYGLPMDISHAIGNIVFMYMFYDVFIYLYEKYIEKGEYSL